MIINQVYINISLLRTLVRNSYMHHLNEVTNFIPNIKYNSHTLILLNIQIFYTIENEYSPDPLPGESSQKMRERVSDALSDKLYVSPALDTASWCNETGYSVYLYVHKVLVCILFFGIFAILLFQVILKGINLLFSCLFKHFNNLLLLLL